MHVIIQVLQGSSLKMYPKGGAVMALTQERRGRIAEQLVWREFRKNRISLDPTEFNRNLGNVSKETGISVDELKGFFEPMVRTSLDRMFLSK